MIEIPALSEILAAAPIVGLVLACVAVGYVGAWIPMRDHIRSLLEEIRDRRK